MARRTEAERIAALKAELEAAEAKAQERAEKAAADSAEKNKAKAARLAKQAERLVASIEADTAKLAEVNLEMAKLDADLTEVANEELFTELTLEEV